MNGVINECSNLVYSIASEYRNNYNIEDLYQVGCIGVIKAYNNFRDNVNVKFSTYAYKYIIGEIVSFIRKDRNIKISDEYFDIYKRYEKVRTILQNKFSREPLFSEIAEFMQIEEDKLARIIESTFFTKSINQGDDKCYDERIIDKLMLDEEIDKLTEPAKSIIRYRYYFGLSQDEVASELNLSQSKVSREEKLALKKIKVNISS